MASNTRTNGARLWDSLMQMARHGATPKGGVKRLTFTAEDRAARDLFRSWCEERGYGVRVDVAGNMFARRQGKRADLAPVLMGSHLDSQPTGGKFDGAYGVLAALEVLRSLDDLEIETLRPIEAVNWTNEEGAIFKPMLGSEMFIGAKSLEDGYAMTEPGGRTFLQGLDTIGYRGATPLKPYPIHCYLEAHIEQGPILEIEKKTIGVVTAGIGLRWYAITIVGVEAHAGPTPMGSRRDALVGAAEIVLAVRQIAAGIEDGRGTVGCLTPQPGSPNVIPGTVEMTVDFRHVSVESLAAMDRALRAQVEATAARHKLKASLRDTAHNPTIPFHPTLVSWVREAAERRGLPSLDIVSGAGHDACHLAKIVPTTMIFIPCEGGISHNEIESATLADCEAGCNVLFDVAIRAANEAKEFD
jgi:N-carbamoyl-L-amino-acid hydrolase